MAMRIATSGRSAIYGWEPLGLAINSYRPESSRRIRALRLRERASQAVFARYLNVTTGLVSQWERGGASLKSLALVAKNGLQAVA